MSVVLASHGVIRERFIQVRNLQRSATAPLPMMQQESCLPFCTGYQPGTRTIITGLEPAEEDRILTRYLSVSATDPDYPAKRREFYADLRREFPYDEPGTLNLSTYADGSPVNALDYLTGMAMLAHHEVAKTEEEAQQSDFYKFYIVDQGAVEKAKKEANRGRKLAEAEFLRLAQDNTEASSDTIRHVLIREARLLDLNVQTVEHFDRDDLEMRLRELLDKDPVRFVEAVSSPDLRDEALLQTLIVFGVVEQHGNACLYGKETIGANEVEAVAYLKNPRNSEAKARMLAALDLKR